MIKFQHIKDGWAYIAFAAGVLYGGYLVLDKYIEIDTGVFESVEHGAEYEPTVDTLGRVVKAIQEDNQAQRAVDEDFRQQALSTIRQGFDKHGEKIENNDEAIQELRYIAREARTLSDIEREKIDAIAAAQKDSERRNRDLARSIRERPVEVIVAPPPTPTPPPE